MKLSENIIMRSTLALQYLICLIPFMVLATALIILGFVLDGRTEVGHHALLIAGGIAIGTGAAHQWHNR